MGTLLVALVALLGLCRADSDLKCDNTTHHEVLACRFPCPPQRTCQNFRGPIPPCVPPRGPCTDQCVCADGYARNKWGGTCVTLAQCGKCPGSNQYFSCDGPYSETCIGSCHCADGYERDANNICVSTTPPPVDTHPSPPPPPIAPSQPVEEPQPVTSGPEILTCNVIQHEISACTYGCPPERTCQNRNWPPLPCAPPDFPCTPKCVCDDGYARNQDGGTCVTLEQCDRCGENEYFLCDGPYSETCIGSCHCADGYERDANNICVPTTPPPVDTPPSPQPPPIVTPSQPVEGPQPVTSGPQILTCNVTQHEISVCTYGCPPEKTCQNRNWPPIPCAPPPFPCTPKCVCDHGYARNQDGGTCVTLEQCDKCGENEYFQCDCDYSEDCVGHCYCFSGYTRDINDKCIYVDPASPPKDNGPPTPEPEDKCPGFNQYFACDGPYSIYCTGSCHCAADYERDANNICVSITPTPRPRVYNPPPAIHPVPPVRPVSPVKSVDPYEPDYYVELPEIAIFL